MPRPAGRLHIVVIWAFASAVVGGCSTLSGTLRADDPVSAVRQPTIEVPPTRDISRTPVADGAVTAAAGHAPSSVAGRAFPIPPQSASLENAASEIGLTPEAVGLLPEDLRLLPPDVGLGAQDVDVMAQVRDSDTKQDDTDTEAPEYDPWEKFNEKMFEFNRRLDRYVLKPVAKVYNKIMPEPFQVAISNGFDNISFVPRMVNSVLQAKWGGAGRELSRFLINSTAGLGGLFDPAKDYWGIRKSREDFGQTLGVWGAGPGPYVVVPFLEPLTVRDGIGKFVDTWLDPAAYFLPLIWTRLGMKVGDIVNDRSLNLDLFQGFEESVIDLYSAVRHGYLQRRENLIRE